MYSHFVENHPIQILEDGPLIFEVVLSHRPHGGGPASPRDAACPPCDAVRIAGPDQDAIAMALIVVARVVVDALNKRVRRKQLADGGELSRVLGDALDAQLNSEWQRGRLGDGQPGPWAKVQLGLPDTKAGIFGQSPIANTGSRQEDQEALVGVEVARDVVVGHAEPPTEGLLDSLTGDMKPRIIAEHDGDDSSGMVVVLRGYHVCRVGDAGVDPLGALRWEAGLGTTRREEALLRHGG
jgi:hypothetical protein